MNSITEALWESLAMAGGSCVIYYDPETNEIEWGASLPMTIGG